MKYFVVTSNLPIFESFYFSTFEEAFEFAKNTNGSLYKGLEIVSFVPSIKKIEEEETEEE